MRNPIKKANKLLFIVTLLIIGTSNTYASDPLGSLLGGSMSSMTPGGQLLLKSVKFDVKVAECRQKVSESQQCVATACDFAKDTENLIDNPTAKKLKKVMTYATTVKNDIALCKLHFEAVKTCVNEITSIYNQAKSVKETVNKTAKETSKIIHILKKFPTPW